MEDSVILQCNGVEFSVPMTIARGSGTLANLLDSCADARDPIPISDHITPDALTCVIEYLRIHANDVVGKPIRRFREFKSTGVSESIPPEETGNRPTDWTDGKKKEPELPIPTSDDEIIKEISPEEAERNLYPLTDEDRALFRITTYDIGDVIVPEVHGPDSYVGPPLPDGFREDMTFVTEHLSEAARYLDIRSLAVRLGHAISETLRKACDHLPTDFAKFYQTHRTMGTKNMFTRKQWARVREKNSWAFDSHEDTLELPYYLPDEEGLPDEGSSGSSEPLPPVEGFDAIDDHT